MLSELMDDKLVVTTKGGRIAIRWMAGDIQKPAEKCKKDKKKGKHTPSGAAVKETEKPVQQPSPMPVSPTASEVIQCINEHLELDPNPDKKPSNPMILVCKDRKKSRKNHLPTMTTPVRGPPVRWIQTMFKLSLRLNKKTNKTTQNQRMRSKQLTLLSSLQRQTRNKITT